MKKLYMALILCCVILTACKEEENNTNPGQPLYTRSFVLQYNQVDSITLRHNRGNSAFYPTDPIMIKVQYTTSDTYKFNSRDQAERDRYQELCQQNRDVTYNRTILYGGLIWMEFPREFTVQSWKHIDLTSDADYDAAHPAGTSLADITEFGTVTAEPYIRSGYTDEYDWTKLQDDPFWKPTLERFTNQYSRFALSPVKKQVTELAPADLKMMGPGKGGYDPIAVMRLTSLPTLEKAHVFTVTFTDTEGKTYPATIHMRFEDLP